MYIFIILFLVSEDMILFIERLLVNMRQIHTMQNKLKNVIFFSLFQHTNRNSNMN